MMPMHKQTGAGLVKAISSTFKKALADVKKAVVGAKKAAKKKTTQKKSKK